MHHLLRTNNPAAKRLANTLMSQTDTQNWDSACEGVDALDTNACFIGCAGTRRDNNFFGR